MNIISSEGYKYKIGGTLAANHPSYVLRKADEQLYQTIKAGEFPYIFNCRQMGKSSLAAQTIKRLTKEGISCAYLNLSVIAISDNTPKQFYQDLIDRLSKQFYLNEKINLQIWLDERENLSLVYKFTLFIEEILRANSNSEKIIIFLDEIDKLFSFESLANNFFTLLRDFYNQRVNNLDYRRLVFCLIGVATPSDLITAPQATPYNIGKVIGLSGFTLSEAKTSLSQGLIEKAENLDEVLNQILYWTGGQPFLTQKLCWLVSNIDDYMTAGSEKSCIENLVLSEIINDWKGQDHPQHLKTIEDRILGDEKYKINLLESYRKVLEDNEINFNEIELVILLKLRLSGLVVKQQGKLKVYNEIYKLVFNSEWIDNELLNIRPYAHLITDWYASSYKDRSKLLRGQALKDALDWAEGKSLSTIDYDFLNASRELERQKATFNEMKSIIASSEALCASNKTFDALIEAIRAKKILQKLGDVDQETKNQVELMLQRAVYNLQEKNRFSKHLSGVLGVAFSPNGKMIASVGEDNTVRLWDEHGNLLNTFEGHTQQIKGVAFSPDGKIIASASSDSTVKLWRLDGTLFKAFKIHGDNEVVRVAFSPNGKMIASASWDMTVKLWSLDGEVFQSFEEHQAQVEDIAFSPDGKMIASASADSTVKLWNLNGSKSKTLEGHKDRVRGVAISPDGKIIASASKDGTVKLWKLVDGKLLKTLTGHNAPVYGVSFSPDGKTIASTSADNTIKLWNLNGKEIDTLTGHSGRVWGVSFNPNGEMIASASWDKTVRLWKVKNDLQTVLKGHSDVVIDVTFSPDGKTIISASDDKTVRLWRTDGTLLKILKGHTGEVYGVAISPDGKMIASGSADGTVKLWSSEGTLLRTLDGNNERNHAFWKVSFSPDGKMIAATSWDSTVKLWNLDDGKLLKTLTGHHAPVYGVSFSPDGKTIASARTDRTVELWNLDGVKSQIFEGHKDRIWDVAFSSDGQIIASASADNTVILWNKNGTPNKTFEGHTAPVIAVAISPDNKIIASASWDNTVKLWNKDGDLLRTLSGHRNRVWGVSFSPDGTLLASASEDRTIIVWDLDKIENLNELKYACNWVQDYLKYNAPENDRHLCDN